MKTKSIEGPGLDGNVRKYSFNLVDASTGLMLFHEYAPLVLSVVNDSLLKEGIDLAVSMKTFRDLFSWEDIQKLSSTLLKGAKICIDDKEYLADDNGLGAYALGDPIEVYTALFYAARANYPKYIDPFFEALEESQGDDSDPTTEKQTLQTQNTL